jgi:lantibiotic modifying enzyme
MREFPALARLFAEHVDDWRRNLIRLSTRLIRDRHVLERTLFGGRDVGDLVELSRELSDRHNRGQAVVLLCFKRGRVIYKPRSGEPEYEWFRLLNWLNKQGVRPALKTLRVIRRAEYCWIEHAPTAECETKGAEDRFWRRLGSLICISLLLDAVDCHRDNVVVAGEHPILVDAETMFHPAQPGRAESADFTSLGGGWLPTGDDQHDAICGISCKGRLPTKHESRELETGFLTCWDLLLSNPKTWAEFAQRRKRMATKKWRHIVRSTSWYQDVCRASIQPQLMLSVSKRCDFLANCCWSDNQNITRQEVNALRRLDIPRFTRSRRSFSRSRCERMSPTAVLAPL